jgi:hypothetical protein
MSKSNLVLRIDRPNFTVELYENMLKIDLKADAKNEIQKGVETKSSLGQILGRILNMFAPLHVKLSDIDSAKADQNGNVKLVLSFARDVVIPLEPKDAARLVDKLNELIQVEKQKELERTMKKHRLQRIEKEELERKQEVTSALGPAGMPIPEPPGVMEEEEEAEKEIEEKEE